MFNTGFYSSRYFNNLTQDGGIMIKSSSNIEKLVAEYNYYYMLPSDKQRFFVQPFDLLVSNDLASYKMEFIQHKNLAELFSLGQMDANSFELFLDKVDEFKHNSYKEDYDRCYSDAKYLVVEKTKTRIQGMPEHYGLVDRISTAFGNMWDKRNTWRIALSHGDLCFSNIIWIPEMQMIKLIDPRGAKVSDQIYMDEYYDLAKLSHSIFGGYESVIYNKDIDYDGIKKLFKDYLSYHGIDFQLLRLYEASLFLSMIPLHMDSKRNMDRFSQICNNILYEIGV